MGDSRNELRVRRWQGLLILWSVLLVSPLAAAEPASDAPAATQPAREGPASLAGFSDDGTFLIYKNEERIVTIRFRWRVDGSYESERAVSLAGQTVSSKMTIQPAADGPWGEIALDTPLGPVTVAPDGGACRVMRKGKPETVALKPGTVLFENFAPALMTQALRQYDQTRGGAQTFPVFVLPKEVVDLVVERLDTVERSAAGRDLKLTRYRYSLVGVDVTLWVDEQGKLYLADVPDQHAAYVREGFEVLRREPATDPLLSQVAYEVTVECGVTVPMRDGVSLAADVYRPVADGPFPVILVRTPYKKEMVELQARYFARRGYVFFVQDCRGRFGSPGVWVPFFNEPEDGYDTIEWLAVQPWSTGKIGMLGGSYSGWAQWWAASRRPPHLVTIIPSVTPPDPFYALPWDHGVFSLAESIWWVDILESEATGDLSGAALSRIGEKDYAKLLRTLPVIDLDKAVLGKENPYWRQWIAHPSNDEYWARANVLSRLQDVDIPVFHQSGWFDEDGIGTKLNYLRMAAQGHAQQKLVLGPWGSSTTAQRRYGDRDFGSSALVDLQQAYLRWCDYWLKGIKNGVADEPLVSVFAMGSNRWLHGRTYPLPETQYQKWYLSSGGRANTSRGDGWLTLEAPAADARPDRYRYDPADPTPDPAAYPSSLDDERQLRSAEEKKQVRDAYHTDLTQARRDILVYESTRLRKPVTFVGPVSAVLYAASSARDTDWFMRLIEVDDTGKLFPLVGGKIRARFRNSLEKPEPLEPGQVYEYRLDLWQTGITIPPGHRLRVEVASAAFPTYARNLNTGGHNEVETEYVAAEQAVYHDADHPSHIVLPVIPEPAGSTAPAQ